MVVSIGAIAIPQWRGSAIISYNYIGNFLTGILKTWNLNINNNA